ncbi:membrane spanning protein [Staphylococcus aureus]|nr:membrane spanning protein [Staphylococcus aureus]
MFSFKDLKDRAFKPLIAVIIVSICLSTVTFIVAKYFYSLDYKYIKKLI